MESFALIVTFAINIWFTVVILRKTKGERYKLIFSLLLISVALWSGAMLFFRILQPGSLVFALARLIYFAAATTALLFFLFADYFPSDRSLLRKPWLAAVLLYYIIVVYLSFFTQYILQGVGNSNGVNYLSYGWGNQVYGLYILLAYGAGAYLLFKKYFRSQGLARLQLRFIILGMVTSGAIGFFNNFVLTYLGDFSYNWLGPSSTLIMVVAINYAMIKHRLMDIRVVLRSSLVYAVTLFALILPIIIIKNIADQSIYRFAGLTDYALLVAAVSVFPFVRRKFYDLANRWCFSSLYDDRRLIATLSERLASTLREKRIYKLISQSLMGAFHPKCLIFLIYNEKERIYEIKYQKGLKYPHRHFFQDSPDINSYLRKHFEAKTLEELKAEENQYAYKLIRYLGDWEAEVVMPMNIRDKIIGLLVLGGKEAEDPYANNDLRTLTTVGTQAAVAINNALSYEEIKNFSKKLEREVTVATHDLRVANKKLRALDEAKSEFVSIASHQLRTPLTVIKGYISMLVEGNFGKINDRVKESLLKVYESNERLIRLVENLLNISRIESGRLHFSFEEVNFESVVDSVYEELETSAQAKSLDFKLQKPKKSCPVSLIDQEKIRQVVMNLVDNAIKYTNSGKVEISIKNKEGAILFCVKDTGIGISQVDLDKLFKKFSRGTDISLVHTEGTGLGLYVAREIVEAHHGRIWVESTGVGHGSSFYFELPIMKDLPPEYKFDIMQS